MIMYTFRGSIVLSILLLSLLNGLSGHPIGGKLRDSRQANPTPDFVKIQTVNHTRRNCTPAHQAEQNNTQDIACILDTLKPFIDSLRQQLQATVTPSNLPMGCNIRSFNSFPELFRALVETVSQLEGTNLAMNYSEAMCTLKNVVQPGLNSTVTNYCDCATGNESVGCSSSSQQLLETGSGSSNEQCLLLSLHRILTRLQSQEHLDGQDVTCRRANGDQKRALLNFSDIIQDYYRRLNPLQFFQRLPPVPCLYRPLKEDMMEHVKSLYTLVPLLSNLSSSEAQLIAGNLTEVILPIVRPLVDASFGEGFYERAVNSSTPLASVSTLSEQERTFCFVNILRVTYRRRFIEELKDRKIIDFCQS